MVSGAVRAGEGGPAPFPLAITGGTGRYAIARGELTLTPTDSSTVPIRVDVHY